MVLKKNNGPQQGVLDFMQYYGNICLFMTQAKREKSNETGKKKKINVIKPWIGVIVNFGMN